MPEKRGYQLAGYRRFSAIVLAQGHDESTDARAGALLAVYRHAAEGVKLGLRYNFTNYSGDLTSYEQS